MTMWSEWLQNKWAKYLLILAIISGLGTGFGYLFGFVDWWRAVTSAPARIDRIEQADSTLIQKVDYLIDYVEKKKKSFAVGYRVVKEIDEHTGKEIWKKQYRDFKGRWNNIHLDVELSEFYGFEYYYYIDPETHEKVYCL